MLGSPQGEFRANVDRLGYGVQIQGTFVAVKGKTLYNRIESWFIGLW
jgi:hypothetical protein